MCNSKARVCRGGSRELYKLIYTYPRIKEEWMNTDNLQIVSGLGHTFLRYNNGEKFIYIDPTIGQFIPSFEGIFVGDEKDLRELAASEGRLDLADYLGPAYEGKKYPLPPLRIETELMKEIQTSVRGGRRRHSVKRRRRTKRVRRT